VETGGKIDGVALQHSGFPPVSSLYPNHIVLKNTPYSSVDDVLKEADDRQKQLLQRLTWITLR